VCTYGLENDSAEWVLQQGRLGVHAAIVDDVVGVLARLQAQQLGEQQAVEQEVVLAELVEALPEGLEGLSGMVKVQA
jgi:uncharacterized protein YidB (DUF937 family)